MTSQTKKYGKTQESNIISELTQYQSHSQLLKEIITYAELQQWLKIWP